MILRARLKGASCALLPFILSGCVTTKIESEPTDFAPSLDTKETGPPPGVKAGSSVEPGWRRVAYRGKIEWTDPAGQPVPDAIVSVCDGDEVYHSTLTDERGNFELPVDLYGTPEQGRWAPETYYVLLVRAPSGQWAKERLREFEIGEPLDVQLERSRY